MMQRILTIIFVALVCYLLFNTPLAAKAADQTCPISANVARALLRVFDDKANVIAAYSIDPYSQGFAATSGNPAGLLYVHQRGSNAEWRVNGVHVFPAWSFKYHILYYDRLGQPVGSAWFGTLREYPYVYFWFVMPAGEANHPNCDYGSADVTAVDELLGE